MTKYLLGGVGLTGITSTCMFYEGMNGIPYSHEKGEISNLVEGEEGEEEPKTLIEKAGLECSGSYCKPSWIGKRKFNVEKDKKDENLVFGYGAKGRIRVHKDSKGYPGELRFTIEGGDIPLYPRRGWFKNSILKLEEFENYEIKNKEGKYYFSRTKNSKEGKILELGLPEACVLPEEGQTTCSVFHVGKVRFGGEGFEGVVDGETSLTITKTEDKTFRDGYKFTFTFPQDVTIGGKVFRANSPVDFRMKKDQKGHLTLEWAWANEKDLLDKVGLECGENGNCTIKSETLKIKKEAKDQDFLNISDISPGKIKLYKDDEYFNGLRLQVGEAKIVSGNNTLEEFETYEIKENGGEYYLLLKRNSEERIRELLKYPCSLSSTSTSSTECNISNERKLNVIKLEGKGENPLSLGNKTVKITVSKAPEADFPVGWKFTFTFPKDVTIGDKVVKANTPTDFKLKRHNDGSLTLERAWASENDLAGKVGLSCDEDNNCTINGGTINIRKGEESQEIQLSTLDGGKIKLYKESAGYSNGIKFTIEEKNIGTGDDTLEEFETYEIKEDSSKYYLALKTSADKKIKELLGYPGRCFDSSDCSGLNEEEIKKINFSGKDQNLMTLQSGKTVKITISKTSESDYLLGRKFIVESTADLTISNSTKVKANVPTEFKIKREDDGQNTNLYLEKAWSEENILIGKVGLDCKDDNCTIKNGSIRIKKEGKDFQFSNLEGGGKIKLYKDAEGYSNGLKFAVEDGKIGTGDDVLEEFETYEIAEDGYYLKLKTSAELEIKKLLKFPDRCYSKSTCENLSEEEFENINFKDKDKNLISIAKDKKVKITVSQAPEDVFPLGRKITVESPAILKISSSTSLKANTPAEFKIEKSGSGQETNLTLEKLWNLKTLTEKVGLSCNDDICTITSGSLNVKRGSELFTKASESNAKGSGKIKLIKDQEGYNEGFKFQIQDGDISLSDDGGKTVVLEEFETYEIKNNGSSHYLERKKTSLEGKWEALGLPEHCRSKFDNTKHGCPISENDLKKIKFSGKDADKSINAEGASYWLKTSSDNSLPKGIRVKMEVNNNREVKIPKKTGGFIILWKGYETEFKVKDEGNGNYSLENVFDVNEMVKAIGITNGNCDDDGGCTIGGKINIYMGGQEYRRDAGVKETTKKITYRYMKDKGFTENLVFRVPDGGINLTGYSGEATKFAGTFNRIKKGTYVIKKYTAGSPNNNELVPYLAREYAGRNYDPNDNFFDFEN